VLLLYIVGNHLGVVVVVYIIVVFIVAVYNGVDVI
jgi:hypothetical protein